MRCWKKRDSIGEKNIFFFKQQSIKGGRRRSRSKMDQHINQVKATEDPHPQDGCEKGAEQVKPPFLSTLIIKKMEGSKN